MKKSALVKVAKELNEVMGLDPHIETKGTSLEYLQEQVREAAKLVEPGDQLSKECLSLMEELLLLPDVLLATEGLSTTPETEITEKRGGGKKEGSMISMIAQLVKESDPVGITKKELLDKMLLMFPDKTEKSMKNLINMQVPTGLSKKRFPVENIQGRYREKRERG